MSANFPVTSHRTCAKCGYSKPALDFVSKTGQRRFFSKQCIDCRTRQMTYRRDSNTGISKAGEAYNRMLREDPSCRICGRVKEDSGKSLALDHDHALGTIRGILCFSCNTGLGKFKDDPDLLLKAASYLQAYKNL